jgi:hypothetical protein
MEIGSRFGEHVENAGFLDRDAVMREPSVMPDGIQFVTQLGSTGIMRDRTPFGQARIRVRDVAYPDVIWSDSISSRSRISWTSAGCSCFSHGSFLGAEIVVPSLLLMTISRCGSSHGETPR